MVLLGVNKSLMIYKGIDLSKNKRIYSYISTYHILDRENYKTYLDSDKTLQKLIKRHHSKQELYKILFNISIYVVLYGISILIKG